MEDIKQRTLRGGFAKVFVQAINFFLRIISLMVLARLLDPKDFGLVGMVMAVAGVFSLFKDAGLSMATVQRESITREQSSTLFWINMLVGAVLAFLLIVAAPILVSFYHERRLFWVAVVLAADFLFTGAAAQHSALLQRQMRFVALAVIEIFALVAGIAVGIGMALGGWGYWALVGMAVVQPAVSAVGYWLTSRWIPGLPRRGVGILSMV
ncbi:MAG TPA: oligosaccharide flippase family protein, partial [Nitrospira sp.]|nr:oligosaccharide flippase family protein [Nitrospira sp.]